MGPKQYVAVSGTTSWSSTPQEGRFALWVKRKTKRTKGEGWFLTLHTG